MFQRFQCLIIIIVIIVILIIIIVDLFTNRSQEDIDSVCCQLVARALDSIRAAVDLGIQLPSLSNHQVLARINGILAFLCSLSVTILTPSLSYRRSIRLEFSNSTLRSMRSVQRINNA